MRRLLFLLGVAALISCARTSTQLTSIPEVVIDHFGEVISGCQNSEDSTTIQEINAVFAIIDPKFSKELRGAKGLSAFISMVEEYKTEKDLEFRPYPPGRNEWWEEILHRLYWGNTHLSTYIYDPLPDARWPFIIQLGTDYTERIRESGYWTPIRTSNIIAKVWILTWRSGPEYAFQSGKGGGDYPIGTRLWSDDDEIAGSPFLGQLNERTQSSGGGDQAIQLAKNEIKVKAEKPKVQVFPNLEKPIEAIISSSVMSPVDDSGAFRVWLNIATWISQLSDSAKTRDSLKIGVAAYDAVTHALVGEADETATGLKERYSRITDEKVRKELPVCVYFGIQLEKGSYDIAISLSGDGERNLGVYKIPLQIPSRTSSSLVLPDSSTWGTGDILIGRKKGWALSVGHGVKLWNGDYFLNSPSSVFPQSNSLSICMEARVPPLAYYEIQVILVPVPKDQLIWQTSQTPKKPEKMLFVKTYRSNSTGLEVFKTDLDLSALPKGRYGLVIRLSDPTSDHMPGEKRWCISSRLIEID